MTAIALLSVAPVTEGSMAEEVAKAVVKADSVDELFAAAQTAHEAVEGDRVSTFLKISMTTFQESYAVVLRCLPFKTNA